MHIFFKTRYPCSMHYIFQD